MSWILNNTIAVLLAVVLCYFGHSIIGGIVALIIWDYPEKRSNDIDKIEYEVPDADD